MPRYEVNIDSPVIYVLGAELVRSYDRRPSEVELSDDEIAEYRKADRAFWYWQARLGDDQ